MVPLQIAGRTVRLQDTQLRSMLPGPAAGTGNRPGRRAGFQHSMLMIIIDPLIQ
jgi:hypothetical protein